MDLNFSAQEIAFRDEVRAFIEANYPKHLRGKNIMREDLSKEDFLAWHKILGQKGWSAPAHRLYLRHVVPLLGHFSTEASAYRYLARSIEEFGTAGEVARRLADAGFETEPPLRLFLGAAAVWRGRKPGH